MRNFHLPLPDGLYTKLQAEARHAKRPATEIARQAIDLWLKQRKRALLHQAIVEYAARHAGTKLDLDPDLEAAGMESWRVSEELEP